MNLFRVFPAAVLLLLVLAGCSARDPIPQSPLPQTEEVVSRLRTRRLPLSFRSIVHVGLESLPGRDSASCSEDIWAEGGDEFSGKAVLLWKMPDALRMEFLSPFGSPLFVVVAGENRLRAYSVADRRFFVGRADSETMAKWLGLPITPALMVRILRGGLPALNDEAAAARMGWDQEAGLVRLDLPPGAGLDRRQEVYLDPRRWEPRRVRIGEEGADLWVRYGPFVRTGEGRRPIWVELEDIRRGRRLRFDMGPKGGGTAGKFSDDLFRLEVPAGATVVPLMSGADR